MGFYEISDAIIFYTDNWCPAKLQMDPLSISPLPPPVQPTYPSTKHPPDPCLNMIKSLNIYNSSPWKNNRTQNNDLNMRPFILSKYSLSTSYCNLALYAGNLPPRPCRSKFLSSSLTCLFWFRCCSSYVLNTPPPHAHISLPFMTASSHRLLSTFLRPLTHSFSLFGSLWWVYGLGPIEDETNENVQNPRKYQQFYFIDSILSRIYDIERGNLGNWHASQR